MALFNIDISKLSSSATVQVVISVAVIGAVMFGGEWLLNRGDSAKIDEVVNTVNHINVEQQFLSEDVARIEEGQEENRQDLSELKDVIEDVGGDVLEVRTTQREQKDDLKDVVILFRDQDKFTPEQMEYLLDQWLKKNNGRIVSGLTLSEDTSTIWSMR